MDGDGLGLDQGFHVGGDTPPRSRAHRGQDLALQLAQRLGAHTGALGGQGVGGAAQGGQLVGVGGLEEAVEAARNTEAPGRRIVDLLHLREHLAHRVAQALGRAPADGEVVSDLVQGGPLGRAGQQAGEAEQAGGFSCRMAILICDRF